MKGAAFLAGVLALWPQIAFAQQAIVLDRYMSPLAGTEDLLTVQHEIASLEDRALPLKLSDESSRLSLLTGIFYRMGKFVALDVPQDHMLLVVGHEVFGHGARLRELGVGHIGYSFDAPLPYGGGGAETTFSGGFPDTLLAALTVDMAGIEAQNTMADAIGDTAVARGTIHYREAWLYFESRYLAMTYVLSASERSAEGNDVADFLRSFKNACLEPDCVPPTFRDLRRGARFALADPLLYFSLYGFASSYIAQGSAFSAIPMIPVGRSLRYLPSLGFQMTPYGTEHLIRNIFVSRRRDNGRSVATVTLRLGTTGATRPWAVDARAGDVRVLRNVHLQVSMDVWRQPSTLADRTSAPLKTGAAGSLTVALPLGRLLHQSRLKATVTVGYKSNGFVPGEQLGGGPVWRVGGTWP